MQLDALPEVDDPQAVRRDARALRRAALLSLAFVAVLWWIESAEALFGFRVDGLGIRPREPLGVIGILLAPLLHGSFSHLVSNSLPLLVLGTLALYFFPRATRPALPLIWLASGLGVWLFARTSVHLGASGLSHGLMFFVFALGVLRRDRPAAVAALVAFFLYGGMLMTILPRAPGVSFEYHFFGAAAGVIAAVAFRRRDPAPPRKRYSWELEEEAMADAAAAERSQYELPRPEHVPVLWQRPETPPSGTGQVIPFPGPRGPRPGIDGEPPTPTRH